MTGVRVPGATCRELVALRPGVYRVAMPDGRSRLVAGAQAEQLGERCAAQDAVLSRLTGEPVDPDELRTVDEDLVDRLGAGGWLATTVLHRDRPLYTLVPMGRPAPRPASAVVDAELSRFAVLRRDGGQVVIESPRAWSDVRVHDSGALAAITGLGDGGLAPPVRQRLVDDLCWAGIMVPPRGEHDRLSLDQWRAHELWFHQRSRLGRRNSLGDRFGGTYWARGRYDPLPAEPDAYPGQPVELVAPDLERLRRSDATLTAVLEDRRTVRDEPRLPPTVEQLGEFLYRCARTRSSRVVGGAEVVSRPHPSGGSFYELEIYPVIKVADGVAPGMYHYDSYRHALRPVADIDTPPVRRMLGLAGRSAETTAPQVLLVISARFGRVMWKYEDISYSLILKHVGVLQQTMYCVATAMGLAPCALGCGDSVAFADATGRDPMTESSVGEFLLGGAVAGDRRAP